MPEIVFNLQLLRVLQIIETEEPIAKAKIHAGNCGYITNVEAKKVEKYCVKLTIESECPHIQKMAAELMEVDALNISYQVNYWKVDASIQMTDI